MHAAAQCSAERTRDLINTSSTECMSLFSFVPLCCSCQRSAYVPQKELRFFRCRSCSSQTCSGAWLLKQPNLLHIQINIFSHYLGLQELKVLLTKYYENSVISLIEINKCNSCE